MIDAAEALLHRAGTLGCIGRYQLESALQSAHIHRRHTGHADWAASAQLLAQTGAYPQARRAYEIAIGLERDPAVRRFLQRRQAALPRRSA